MAWHVIKPTNRSNITGHFMVLVKVLHIGEELEYAGFLKVLDLIQQAF